MGEQKKHTLKAPQNHAVLTSVNVARGSELERYIATTTMGSNRGHSNSWVTNNCLNAHVSTIHKHIDDFDSNPNALNLNVVAFKPSMKSCANIFVHNVNDKCNHSALNLNISFSIHMQKRFTLN